MGIEKRDKQHANRNRRAALGSTDTRSALIVGRIGKSTRTSSALTEEQMGKGKGGRPLSPEEQELQDFARRPRMEVPPTPSRARPAPAVQKTTTPPSSPAPVVQKTTTPPSSPAPVVQKTTTPPSPPAPAVRTLNASPAPAARKPSVVAPPAPSSNSEPWNVVITLEVRPPRQIPSGSEAVSGFDPMPQARLNFRGEGWISNGFLYRRRSDSAYLAKITYCPWPLPPGKRHRFILCLIQQGPIDQDAARNALNRAGIHGTTVNDELPFVAALQDFVTKLPN